MLFGCLYPIILMKVAFGIILFFIFFVCREQASSASGKAASGMSSDERNQVLYLL